MLYVSKLTSVTEYSMLLYADDEITRDVDAYAFQADLDVLVSWSQEWKMSVNAAKCVHIPSL